MTWLAVCALALAAFAVLILVLKAPRPAWAALGTTLLLGLAGYAVQASPDQPGSPKPELEKMPGDPGTMIAARELFDDDGIAPTDKWIVIADGMARHGQFAEASHVLLGAIDEDPDNAEAWLALGNALVAHADGLLTPAALHAFRQAQAAAPESAGPPYFLGLAMAQSGRFTEARGLWSGLLERAPANAEWRTMLGEQLSRLDLLIAMQASDGANR
jgi:cytochrome c-type biogenesis protein CcmH